MLFNIFLIFLEDKLNQYLFLHSVLTVLIALIYFFPFQTLHISGYVHLRILKWILVTLGLSISIFVLHSRKLQISIFKN